MKQLFPLVVSLVLYISAIPAPAQTIQPEVAPDKFSAADTTYTTVPARRQITFRDLLTHTSGLDYPLIGSKNMQVIYQSITR